MPPSKAAATRKGQASNNGTKEKETTTAPASTTDNNTNTNTVRTFLTSTATIVVTLIRIGSLLLLPSSSSTSKSNTSILGWFLNNPDLAPLWTSLLIRPNETWNHLREAQAIRGLFATTAATAAAGGTTTTTTPFFRDAYRGSYLHLPPLVVAALEGLLNTIVPIHDPSLWIGILTHGVDLMIAIQWIQLGKHVLEELRDPWEDDLQPRIPKSIRPTLTHMFAISDAPLTYTNELPDVAVVPVDTTSDSTNDNNDDQSQQKTKAGPEDSNDNRTRPPTILAPPTEESNKDDDKDDDNLPITSWASFSNIPLLAAQLYYYSPLTALASGLGGSPYLQSFQNVWVLLLLLSLNAACRRPQSTSTSSSGSHMAAFWLALASYMELHYVVFLVPICLWMQRRQQQQQQQRNDTTGTVDGSSTNVGYTLLLSYAFWFACLQGLSLLLVGRSKFTAVLYSSYGHVYTWKHVHPNLSVLWYLNMELFERFRIYFAVLIGGLPYLMVAPVTIRLHRYPMVLVTISWMLWTLIRPTTTLVDANIACCLAVLCPRSLARMRIATSLIPAFAITVPIGLYLVTLWLWLETGSGEANFTFFQCLAYCAFLATLFLEFCGASMRRDKVLRLTEKLCRTKENESLGRDDDSKVDDKGASQQ